jgi:hypothetical protein
MRASQRFVILVAGSMLALGAIASTAAAAKPSAEYRFEDSFKSSIQGAKALSPEGPARMCPPCQEFDRVKVDGKKQGVWRWPEGDGLRLANADKLLDHGGKTYTFAMLVNFEAVSSYRKLVDFQDRQEDVGWYVYDESLYPYDLSDFDYSKQKIQADEWHQIVLTRDGSGFARGFVDGKMIGKDRDPNKEVSLRSDKLHFLIDNEDGSEQSGGMIARLRIWENALDPNQVKDLGS